MVVVSVGGLIKLQRGVLAGWAQTARLAFPRSCGNS